MRKVVFYLIGALSVAVIPLKGDSSPSRLLVEMTENSYKRGEYEGFLKLLDEEYQRAGKAGLLNNLYREAHKSSIAHTLSEQQKEQLISWHKMEKSLSQERNQRLKDLCSVGTDLEICKRIESLVSLSLVEDQEEALEALSFLKFQFPNDKNLTIEGRLAAVEAEYELKNALLEVAAQKKSSKTVEPKKKIALSLDKLRKMEGIVTQFNDSKWKRIVEKAKEAYETHLTYEVELDYFKALARGQIAPQNGVEEEAKKIMSDYIAKKKELKESFFKAK